MPEFIPLEKMSIPRFGDGPEWLEAYGEEVRYDKFFLNGVYNQIRDQPIEECNKLLKVVVEDIIPMRNRFRQLRASERIEAKALCSKYTDQESGLFNVVQREYETYLAGLETRNPPLAKWIKRAYEEDEVGARMDIGDSRTVCSGKYMCTYNTGHRVNNWGLAMQSLEDVRDHVLKKSALLEDQTRILIRALEENGIQLPHESTAIQSQIDMLKQPLPALVEESSQKAGEAREELGSRSNSQLLSVHEDPTGSIFTATYKTLGERVPPPKHKADPYVPLPEEMDREEMRELLKSMHRFNCGKFFETPITKEKSPEYFDLVKEHRDLVSIKNELDKGPQYRAKQFFDDIRIMLDNYTHVFGKESDEHKMAERFEEAILKKLEDYGEAGQTGKVCELPAVGLYKSSGAC